MGITGIVQARLGSSRLPRKVLLDICGRPSLGIQFDRLRKCRNLEKIVLATTTSEADVELVDFATAEGIKCFRGSESDVLDRFYQAAKSVGAEHICRLTADCPLSDPVEIDRVASSYLNNISKYSYVHRGETYPEGLAECEFFSFASLEVAWKEAKSQVEREHVTQFFFRNAQRFSRLTVEYKRDLSKLRVGLDEPVDLEVIRILVGRLGAGVKTGIEEIASFLEANEDVCRINNSIIRNEGLAISLAKKYEG